MMKGSEEAATSSRGRGAGRGQRKKMPKFSQEEKENYNIYGGDVVTNENKSPLPEGFPRAPLQDITAILLPNNISDEEPSTEMRKPFTRSQGARKMESVRTRILSERISRNVIRSASNRGGPSKTRVKHVMKTVTLSGEATLSEEEGLSKQDTIRQTINISSLVKVSDQTEEGKHIQGDVSPADGTPVQAAEGTHTSGSTGSVSRTDKESEVRRTDLTEALTKIEQERPAPAEPLEVSAPRISGTENQFYQEQKRRKPLSARSSVSGFR